MGDMNITALEMAATKCWPLGVSHPMGVKCDSCDTIKKLHGVWRMFKWFCPRCAMRRGFGL